MNAHDEHAIRREWDAGEAGCSRLIVGIRKQIDEVQPGGVLRVIARGEAAQIDIPVWCRMSGNPLLAEDHPIYIIRRTG